MKLIRYMRVGRDSTGKVTQYFAGWSSWEDTSFDGNRKEQTKGHRTWMVPDELGRRYHPEWVSMAFMFECMDVVPVEGSLTRYDELLEPARPISGDGQ